MQIDVYIGSRLGKILRPWYTELAQAGGNPIRGQRDDAPALDDRHRFSVFSSPGLADRRAYLRGTEYDFSVTRPIAP
ncbi:MAG: hypothetical protein ABJD13_00300 [Paracoccaceae bacterium]